MSAVKLNGKCHCLQFSFEAVAEKDFEFLCYCQDCRKLSGGHLAGIAIAKNKLKYQGNYSVYSYDGGSGEKIHLYFCRQCSTQIFALLDSHPETVILRAANLDNGEPFTPNKVLFAESAFKWDLPLK